MFVQFIQGPVGDADLFRRQHQRWLEEVAPGADGWLGVTAGVTPDGTGFVAARFESEEAARRNSDRSEQGAWWQEAEKAFSGPVTFTDCTDVDLFLGGGSDDAGFVQVIRGTVNDADRARGLLGAMEDSIRDSRPDVLGGLVGTQDDGSFTQVVYFSSEEEAREGERRAPAEDDEVDQEFASLVVGEMTFLDLPEPWLASP